MEAAIPAAITIPISVRMFTSNAIALAALAIAFSVFREINKKSTTITFSFSVFAISLLREIDGRSRTILRKIDGTIYTSTYSGERSIPAL